MLKVQIISSIILLSTLGACKVQNEMADNLLDKHEEISLLLLREEFRDLKHLKQFLDETNVGYEINKYPVVLDSSKIANISCDNKNIYSLVLLPRNLKKLFRFRVCYTKENKFQLEEDYGYKNPYQ